MLPQYIAQYYNGYHNMMDGGDWGWGLLMMLFWAVLIVLVTVFVVRGLHTHDNSGSTSGDAVEIAKKRYAKGEISKEEFEQLKKDLK